MITGVGRRHAIAYGGRGRTSVVSPQAAWQRYRPFPARAGGQAQAKGKIFRIAHMGFIDTVDLLGTLGGLETVLGGLGYKVEPGAGLRAAQAILTTEAGA